MIKAVPLPGSVPSTASWALIRCWWSRTDRMRISRRTSSPVMVVPLRLLLPLARKHFTAYSRPVRCSLASHTSALPPLPSSRPTS